MNTSQNTDASADTEENNTDWCVRGYRTQPIRRIPIQAGTENIEGIPRCYNR